MRISLSKLQSEQSAWAFRNFGHRMSIHPLLGMVEELGELAHAVLKSMQGIRGTTEEHAAEMKDAVADLIIFACDYATSMGWDLEVILADTWSEVKQRDFKAYPKNGRNA